MNGPSHVASDELYRYVNVAACRSRVRTIFVCFVDQTFCDIAIQTRQPAIEPSAEKVARVPKDQVYFGFDAAFCWHRDFPFARRDRNRAFEGCRPGSREQL